MSAVELAEVGSVQPTSECLVDIAMRTVPARVNIEKGFRLDTPLLNLNTLPGFITEFYDIETQMHVLHCMVGESAKEEPQTPSSGPTFFYDTESVQEKRIYGFIDNLKDRRLANLSIQNIPMQFRGAKLRENLPLSLKEQFTPVITKNGPLSFFEAVSIAMFSNPFCSKALHMAIIHNCIDTPKAWSNYCNLLGEDFGEAVLNLAKQKPPTRSEILVLSSIMERRINVFSFDEYGNFESGKYFDAKPNMSRMKSDINALKIGDQYYPLLTNETLMTQTVTNPKDKDKMHDPSTISEGKQKFPNNKKPEGCFYPGLFNGDNGRKIKYKGSEYLNNPSIDDDCRNACDLLMSKLQDKNIGDNTISSFTKIQVDKNVTSRLPTPLKDWTAITTERDGNCFYSAVSTGLIGDQTLGTLLRTSAYLELMRNQELRKSIVDAFGEEAAIYNLIQNGAWAVPPNMYIMSAVIRRRIVVFRRGNKNNDINGTYYDATDGEWEKSKFLPVCLFLDGDHFSTIVRNSISTTIPSVKYELQDFRTSKLHKEKLRQHIYATTGRELPKTDIETVDLSDDSDTIDDEGLTKSPPQKNGWTSFQTTYVDRDSFLTEAAINLNERNNILVTNHEKQCQGEDDKPSDSSIDDNEHYCSTCASTVVEADLSESQISFTGADNKNMHQSNLSNVLEKKKLLTSKLFNNLNNELLEETLERMGAEILNLNHRAAVDLYVRNIVVVPGLWQQHLQYIWTNRKSSKVELRNRARTLHSLQKQNSVRTMVRTMLTEVNAAASISIYDLETKKKGWVESSKNEIETKPETKSSTTVLNQFEVVDKPLEFHRLHIPKKDGLEFLNKPHDIEASMKEPWPIENVNNSNQANPEQVNVEDLDDKISNDPVMEKIKREKFETQEKLEFDADQQIAENQNDVSIEALCLALQLDKDDLLYQPPMSFEIEIAGERLKHSFDFEKNLFKKYTWAKLVSDALTSKQKCCSFIARSTPQYNAKKNYPFCTMLGKCPCGMKFVVSIKDAPVKGLAITCNVVSEGIFHLKQDRKTSRPVTGVDREKLEAEFRNSKPKKQYLKDLQHLSGLRVLHKNFRYKSASVLKKIRSDVKIQKRTHKDKVQELNLITEKFKDQKIPEGQLNGYIQSRNTTPGEFSIILYNRNSLILHADQISKRDVTIHIDATGGLCKKVSEKQILLYVVHAVTTFNDKKVSYPIGESLMESGTSADIANFLGKIKDSLIKLRPTYRYKPIAKIVVCDWSYAMIHGILKGLNVETIVDYLNRSWMFISEGVPWDITRSSVFICSSHLIKAVQRNLYQKLTRTKENRAVVNLALKAVARFQECFTLNEFLDITKTFVRTFGNEYIDSSELKTNVAVFVLTKTFSHDKLEEEPAEASCIIEPTPGKLLRDHSKFFHAFKAIRDSERTQYQEIFTDDLTVNPYFCPKVVEVIMNDKIPLWPLWAAAIQQKLGNTTFLRATNASVESEFNIRKNVYHDKKNGDFIDYVQEAEKYHNQRIREAIIKLTVPEKKFDYRKRKNTAEDTPEKWSKRKQTKAKHFSGRLIDVTSINQDGEFKHQNSGDSVGLNKNEHTTNNTEGRENVNADSNVLRSKIDDAVKNGIENETETNAVEEGIKPWKRDNNGTLIICSVINKDGSITLRRKDLARALTGNLWLHSDIIDAYMSISANKLNPFNVHITPSNYVYFYANGNAGLGSWIGSGVVEPPWIDIPHSSKYFLHPLNIHGNHWILLFFDTCEQICTIYDSLRGPKGSQSRKDLINDVKTEILKVFGKNSAAFVSANYHNSPWIVIFDETIPVQNDSYACGVNILVNAKHLLKDPKGKLLSANLDVIKEREVIIREILASTEFGNGMLQEANGDFAILTKLIVSNVEVENLNFSY